MVMSIYVGKYLGIILYKYALIKLAISTDLHALNI